MSGEIVVRINRLASFGDVLDKAVQLALNQGAVAITDDAKQSVDVAYPPASEPGEPPHRRTGDLQAGIHEVPNAAYMEADVVSEAPYSSTLEFGSADGRIAPRPFMRPAVERWQARNSIEADIETIIRQELPA